MAIPISIERQIKNTVGYNEATNKDSFMVGAAIAFVKATTMYKGQIELLQRQLMQQTSEFKTVDNDMRTLVNILNKYREPLF
jgi:hypothetical protein